MSPSSHLPYRYEEVHSIILSWEEDDLDLEQELEELNSAFMSLKFTSTRTYRIPSVGPQNALSSELHNFLDGKEDSLLVVYYGGHGGLDDHRHLRIAGTQHADGPSLDWQGIQITLECAAQDILIILDCCYASAAAATFVPGGFRQGGQTEILAGCGFEGRTQGVGPYSTTRALTRELNLRADRGETFSVVQLHQRLLAKMSHQHPVNNPDSREEDFDACFPTPVYVSLCSDYRQPSIPLRRLSLDRDEGLGHHGWGDCSKDESAQWGDGSWEDKASAQTSEAPSTEGGTWSADLPDTGATTPLPDPDVEGSGTEEPTLFAQLPGQKAQEHVESSLQRSVWMGWT